MVYQALELGLGSGSGLGGVLRWCTRHAWGDAREGVQRNAPWRHLQQSKHSSDTSTIRIAPHAIPYANNPDQMTEHLHELEDEADMVAEVYLMQCLC